MEEKFENFSKVSYAAFENALQNEEKAEFQIGERAYTPILVNGKRKEYCIKEVRLCGVYFDNNGILHDRGLYEHRLYIDDKGDIYEDKYDFVCTDRNIACEVVIDTYDGKIVEEGEDAL